MISSASIVCWVPNTSGGHVKKVVFLFKPHRVAREVLVNAGFTVKYYRGRDALADKEWVASELKDADVIVVTPYQAVNESLLAVAPKLKLLMIHGSGYDRLDLEALSKRCVCVANAPDYVADAVAEHALALTLATLRNVVMGDKHVRSGEWCEGAAPRKFLGLQLAGRKVGIVGLGRVGAKAAALFKAVGASVTYWSRRRKVEVEHALGIRFEGLEELLSTSDVVVISVALTPRTRGLIGRRELSLMKEGALLVNVARGEVVDMDALIEALQEGRIKAALDVFPEEPLPRDHPLTKLNNVILTPHVAGYTLESVIHTGRYVAEAIIGYFIEKRVPPTALNAERCVECLKKHLQ